VHLVERCLQKDPKQRLRGLGGVELAFDDRTTSAPSLRRWPLALGGVAALALVAGAAWSLNGRPAPVDVAPIRFEIPPSIRVAENGSFALSPDGRRLAFIGTGADGRFRMWERSLDSLEAKPIGGTEGEPDPSTTLFWSPDSRFIGFYANGAVRRIDRSGGQVQIICRVPSIAVGGTWNQRDEIVVGNVAGGLLRCPAGGGDPVLVAEPAETGSARTGDFFPVFLPDGRRLLYLRISRTDPSIVGLYLADLDRPATAQSKTRLIETGFGARFARTADGHGHILFVRNRGVWAVPFDTRQLVTTGEPVMIVESVGTFRDGAFFDTNGSVLVHRGGTPDFRLAWRDRRGADLGAVGEPGQYTAVALSADGQRAAVTRDNKVNRGDNDLWLVDLQRNTTTPFTSDAFGESVPAWTPDSRSLVYATGIGRGDIRQRMLDGGQGSILLHGRDIDAGDVNPLFTTMSIGANGNWLAFAVEARGSTRYDIWKLRLRPTASAASPMVQDERDQTQPSLAPDGEWLAYMSNESGTSQVMVRPLRLDTDGVPAPGAPIVVSRGGGRSPRWRADSQELYFQGTDGGIMAVRVDAGSIGEPARLFSMQGALAEWGVAPNGERFLFGIPSAANELPFTVFLNWQAGLR
jgi:Tol biopolymer transport system component